MNSIKGVIPAIITPIDPETQEVDYLAFAELIDFLIEKGVHGLFPGGTTGEGPLLSFEERVRLIEKTVLHVNGRVAVIAHTGSANPLETIKLSKIAESLGVTAVSTITPFFSKATDEQIYEYFNSLAQACSGIPLYLYNIPQRTGNPISAKNLAKLAKVDNIKGLKDSSGNAAFIQTALELGESYDFDLFVGDDRLDLYGLQLGAVGIVSSMAGIVPEVYVELYNAVRSGDYVRAIEAQKSINTFCKLFRDGTSMSLFKIALRARGIDVGVPRWPFGEADLPEWPVLETHLRENGMLSGKGSNF